MCVVATCGMHLCQPDDKQTPTQTHSRPCPSAATANCTYTCRAGDSLEATALALGTTAEALQAVNGGAELAVLLPGQVLRLPVGVVCPGGCVCRLHV
jgi:LysM repeat protein